MYWGDTHLHTSYSTDAGMVGTTLGPDDAYRFVLGEAVTSNTGQPAKLQRPLDFVVIADHAEMLGLSPFIARSDPSVLADPLGKKWHDMVKAGKGYDAFIEWANFGSERPFDSQEITRSAWDDMLASAEKYNDPGAFTAFIGFEWTSMPGGDNIHRVVVFRDDADRATQVVPFSAYDSENPEKLWEYMAAYEAKTGGRMLAIPHNGNLSNGRFFELQKFEGEPLDAEWAAPVQVSAFALMSRHRRSRSGRSAISARSPVSVRSLHSAMRGSQTRSSSTSSRGSLRNSARR